MGKSLKTIIKLIMKKFGFQIVRTSKTPNWHENHPCEACGAYEFSDMDENLAIKFKPIIQNNLDLNKFREKISHLYHSKRWELGKGVLYPSTQFYQSFEKLRIEGQRPTTFRFYAYGLDQLLKKDYRVLDIGCNCGFFALHIAEHVRHVDGVEFNKELVDVANATKDYLHIKNCDFHYMDFNQFTTERKYDIIFSFAVHYWIGMPMKEYALKLYNLLNPNGFVVFESQDINTKDADFEEKIKEFAENRFKVIYGASMMTDRDYPRKFKILLRLEVN